MSSGPTKSTDTDVLSFKKRTENRKTRQHKKLIPCSVARRNLINENCKVVSGWRGPRMVARDSIEFRGYLHP